ncbi:hypothetical protein CAPTEDRAFT_226291 [Capitella teleta]|uniref:Pantothenate kinase n=1 Tax=Capitella teleta TaxID=283909 RepID=R7TSG4_CAPTE|nr:hypothetical protein CAPTEDRAFT_226291 [Capitella teleta]|eukprot:ELT96599.1 hypothetical protein CAPTEDRAFT_226291 [Capitella teleta]
MPKWLVLRSGVGTEKRAHLDAPVVVIAAFLEISQFLRPSMADGLNAESLILPSMATRLDPLHPGHGQPASFALDIGGTLAKVAYLCPKAEGKCCGSSELRLVSFKTDDLDTCLNFIRHHVISYSNNHNITVYSTGVGCSKYRQKIADTLSVDLQADTREMDHALNGVDFLWRHLPSNQLVYEGSDVKGLNFGVPFAQSGVGPCILITLGSALCISKVSAEGSCEGLVGGSSQGGLTFLGLGALLTKAQSFEELIQLAEKGDRRNVDLLVKDTAGSDYNNAPSDSMVSSFGKAAKMLAQKSGERLSEADIASSLLYLITDQMAQTVYLVAKCQNVSRAVFCGSFLSHNQSIISQIREKLASASVYLDHTVSPVFMQREGYMGAIGVLAAQMNLCTNGTTFHVPDLAT